jgi:hypothetical protein
VLKLLTAAMVLGERLLPVPEVFTAEGLRETLAHQMRLLGMRGTDG